MATARKQTALRAALGLLACALTVLLYQRTVDAPFVFDDRANVLLNPSLADAWNLRAALLYNVARSLVNLSYAIDRAFWGFSALGFHITNGVLHVLVVGLFYGWCTRALTDELRVGSDRGQTGVKPRGGQARDRPEWPAFYAATAFAAHPLTSATVLYISARSELLCATAFLTALILARRAVIKSSRTSGLLAAGCGVAAFLSSPAAAALPLVVLTYDAWVLRASGWSRRMRRVYAPALLTAVAAGAWRVWSIAGAVRVPQRGPVGNLLTEALVIWRYVLLVVAPHRQALVHDVHWARTPLDPAGILAFAGLIACIGAAIGITRSKPLAAFGIFWFVAALAPTSSLVPLRDAMAESRTYVASCGLFLAAAAVFYRPLSTYRSARAVATGVLVVLSALTYARTRVWADPIALWQEALRRAPGSWQAHLGYADALSELHQCAPARLEYSTALRLFPDNRDAQGGLKRCR